MLHIRPAHATDAADIARLTTELGYPTAADEMKARLDTLLPRDSQYIAVAELSSEIVGWVAVEHRMLLESGDRAEIVGLVVSSSSRRAGVGSALVREAEDWVLQRGLRAIGVRSNVARIEAHPFYEGLGYVRAKTQHAYRKELGDRT
jgi:GNAT superfamily N-acetyltransferase